MACIQAWGGSKTKTLKGQEASRREGHIAAMQEKFEKKTRELGRGVSKSSREKEVEGGRFFQSGRGVSSHPLLQKHTRNPHFLGMKEEERTGKDSPLARRKTMCHIL